MDKQRTKFYETFNALYRVKAQKVKVLMGSEKYKDAYSSDIDKDLKISPTEIGGVIRITKEPSKLRKRTLSIVFINISLVEIVNISSYKYDSSDKRSESDDAIEGIFDGNLLEFMAVDIEEVIKKNLEDFIPID